MDPALFEELMQGMEEMGQIVRGERPPARMTVVEPMQVRSIRQSTGLSQARFARVIRVPLGTLRNWEQGHRGPTGPARALLHLIRKDPEFVIRSLQDAV